MKNKYLKYTLLSIAISSSLLLTSCGCGKKSEPLNEAPAEVTAIEETTTDENTTESENNENMETVNNADRGNAEGEQGEATSVEQIGKENTSASNGEGKVDTPSSDGFSEGSGFNPSENITQNPDGSYSFSENFMVSVQTIDGFSDLTPENQQKLLQEIAPLIGEDDNEEDVIAALSSFVGMYEYDEAVAKQEQAQQKPQQTQTQQKPQNNVSNSGGQSNNNTPDVQHQGMQSNSQAPTDNIGPGPMDDFFTPEDGTAGETLGTVTPTDWR